MTDGQSDIQIILQWLRLYFLVRNYREDKKQAC